MSKRNAVRAVCIISTNDRVFTVGKIYTRKMGRIYDNTGYGWALSFEAFNEIEQCVYRFKTLDFEVYYEQCERLVDSGLPESKGV